MSEINLKSLRKVLLRKRNKDNHDLDLPGLLMEKLGALEEILDRAHGSDPSKTERFQDLINFLSTWSKESEVERLGQELNLARSKIIRAISSERDDLIPIYISNLVRGIKNH